MADVYNKGALTRDWWAGANADVDIHIEAYEGDIEGSFEVTSLFRSTGLTNYKNVQNQSNTWRGDRIGAATVKSRRSGETLDAARIANDKLVVTVDAVSYIRTPIDFQDDWTAPDFRAEHSREHGTAHAKAFDEAHIIQLIKCQDFTPPAHLAGAFHKGIGIEATGYSAATAKKVQAELLVQAHLDGLTQLIERDLGDEELVTLIRPAEFSVLLNHDKLMNVEFQGGQGENSFSRRRIAVLNGVRVIETPRFPKGVNSAHILGPSFNVDADEARAGMATFVPSKALVTVEAHPMTFKRWTDDENFQTVLDSFCMYTVGQYRPDAVFVVSIDASTP